MSQSEKEDSPARPKSPSIFLLSYNAISNGEREQKYGARLASNPIPRAPLSTHVRRPPLGDSTQERALQPTFQAYVTTRLLYSTRSSNLTCDPPKMSRALPSPTMDVRPSSARVRARAHLPKVRSTRPFESLLTSSRSAMSGDGLQESRGGRGRVRMG